jgi:hypothetical protein
VPLLLAVLDYGCGNGKLLQRLASYLTGPSASAATLVGADPAVHTSDASNKIRGISGSSSTSSNSSQMLEHLVYAVLHGLIGCTRAAADMVRTPGCVSWGVGLGP